MEIPTLVAADVAAVAGDQRVEHRGRPDLDACVVSRPTRQRIGDPDERNSFAQGDDDADGPVAWRRGP